MRSPNLLRAALAVALLAPASTSSAFDTVWHNAATSYAGQQNGFTNDAINAMQFGTFAPDFFAPIYGHLPLLLGTAKKIWEPFDKLRNSVPAVLAASVVLHFDNVDAAIDRNWKLDYLLRRLLANTQIAIKGFQSDTSLTDGRRKLLVLMTLGSSLHAMEDFYSHSNWTHFDFVELGFPQQRNSFHQDYAPSWFQVVDKLGPPAFPGKETWSIEVRTGVYEPKQPFSLTDAFGKPLDHSFMMHDNSQMTDEGKPRTKSHELGPHPTHGNDVAAHHLFAANTAGTAAIEWVALVERDADAKVAIAGARTVKAAGASAIGLGSLDAALVDVLAASCAVHHWNGSNPPQKHKTQCDAVLGKYAIPLSTNLMAAPYWSGYLKDGILEKLVVGIGDGNGHYTFDETWYKAHRPPDPTTTKVIHLDPIKLTITVPNNTTVKSQSSSKVVVTSSEVGELVVEVAQAQPPPPPPPPDPPPPPPQDPNNYERIYRIPSATGKFKVIGQRTFGSQTYACGGTGTQAQADAIVAACTSLSK